MKQEEAIDFFAKARAEASTAGEVAWMPSLENCNGSIWRFGRLEASCGGQRRQLRNTCRCLHRAKLGGVC